MANPEGEKFILSVDPGETTGIAVLDVRVGDVVTTFASERPFSELRSFLSAVKDDPFQWEFVCEDAPAAPGRHHSDAFEEVRSILFDADPSTVLVTPNRWKGHPWSRLERIRGVTSHEQDAARLGSWYRRMREHGIIERSEPARADA